MHIDVLIHKRRTSSALAMELHVTRKKFQLSAMVAFAFIAQQLFGFLLAHLPLPMDLIISDSSLANFFL